MESSASRDYLKSMVLDESFLCGERNIEEERKKEKKAWGGLPQSQRNPMVLFSSSVYAFARGHNHNVSCINALPYYKSLLFEALCVVTSLGLADPSLFHASFYSYFIFISLCSGFST